MRIALLGTLLLAATLSDPAAYGQSSLPAGSESTVAVNIERQAVREALRVFGEQTGVQVLFRSEGVTTQGVTSQRVVGQFSAQEALARLLANTGLKYEFVNEHTVRVSAAVETPPTSDSHASSAKESGDGPYTAEVGSQGNSSNSSTSSSGASQTKPDQLEQVTVTGTRIRGGTTASPMNSYSQSQIEQSGYTTTEQFISSLPQNFSGFVSTFAAAAGAQSGVERSAGDTAVDIHGLGGQATLTLLDGHRLAPNGYGSYVNVSMIPLSAVERIDVLTDGASALYGSDAVAGVVNFKLKDGYSGAETLLDYGAVTSGGYASTRIAQSLGEAWSSGDILLAYDYTDNTRLRSSDRSFYPASSTNEDLVPPETRQSGLLVFHQKISEQFSLYGEGLYSEKTIDTDSLGLGVNDHESAYFLNVGARYDFNSSWSLDISGTGARNLLAEQRSSLSTGRESTNDSIRSDYASADAVINGSLVSLPAGPVKIATGAGYHGESLRQFNDLTNSLARSTSRTVLAGFGELQVPIFSGQNAIPLFNELTASVALRVERYSDFGSTTNPKFGLRWKPTSSLLVRSTYGTSFRAPSLYDLASPTQAAIFPVEDPLGTSPGRNPLGLPGPWSPALILSGGNPNLGPERSRSITAGIDFVPPTHSNAKFGITYFNTDYTDRIQVPGVYYSMLLNQNIYSDFIQRNPTLQQLNETIAAQGSYSSPLGLPLSAVTSTIDTREQNVAAVDVNGVDFEVSDQFTFAGGEIVADLNSEYLIGYDRTLTKTSPSQGLVNTLYYPPRFRSRATFAWSTKVISFNAAVNYTNAYKDTASVPNGIVSDFTTVDVGASYTFGRQAFVPLRGLRLALNITNLLDAGPPRVPQVLAGYDGANANPLGRIVGVSLKKRW